MTRSLHRAISVLIATFGVMISLGYAAAIALADNRKDATEEWGTVAGFAMFSAIAALFWFGSTFKLTDEPSGQLRLPPVWLSLFVFCLMVGFGFAIQVVDRAAYLAPILACVAFVAVAAFFLRAASHWLPGQRVGVKDIVSSAVWGVFVAPIILIAVQGTAVVFIVIAILAGIYGDDPEFEFDPNLEDRISAYLEESGASATSTDLPEIIESPTVALSLFSVVAIIAPLSEELVKAVGAILVLSRRRSVSASNALLVSVAAGLGFAVFEGIGYTLASPTSWHQLILLRAPVVIMHVAATSIIVMGWYRSYISGKGFIPYFAVGVAVHAGWNALYVGFIYSLTGMSSGVDPTAGQAIAVVAMVLLLGALFVCAIAWFVTVSRRVGAEATGDSYEQTLIQNSPTSLSATPGLG